MIIWSCTIVLSFFAVTAKAETTAPSYYELDGCGSRQFVLCIMRNS